ncbi:LuxR C-terminal-related transcriptional regulator [Nocardioides sp. cx-169]|uniref:helix-turn-helix transcriptional regulator n=1 Tax=Nocardioides sp. cx-169 TaxID=2899080 RepID=UPI001E5BB0A3|nr:LuxR C-terminal-related transcriptional regulator [Nocardioides sp. cx-169]MCD4536139.1 LuxR C-terminal-related transcriptional regulator [Nocardioides sp. cx-169]
MPAGLRVAILTSRDLVRHGVEGMLARLPLPVYFVDKIDHSYAADLIIVDATGTPDADAAGLQGVTIDDLAPVILLTSRDAAPGFDTWETPIHSYVTVSATDAELVGAVAAALRASMVTRAARAVASPRISDGLSGRELDILKSVAAGKSNHEIAADLFLGLNTVKTYIRAAYKKIGVTTRPHAILWALGHGLGRGGVGHVVEGTHEQWAGDDPESSDAPLGP